VILEDKFRRLQLKPLNAIRPDDDDDEDEDEDEDDDDDDDRSSSCLELTAASPSLPVHQSQSVSSRAQDSSFQAGLSLTFPLRTIEEIELN